jgi:3-hydroxyacyl-CoA dehydrogenase
LAIADTLLRAGRYFASEIDDQRFEPPEILAEHVAQGWTGMNAGRGLRELDADASSAIQRERTATFVALLRHLGLLPSPPG